MASTELKARVIPDSADLTGDVTSPVERQHVGMAYRSDIDGLRAVAVLLVVVFHAFPASMGGGYIGVDVFFVISGYLISGIIFERLALGSFSIVDFYIRRVRRIFPALLTVLAASLILGAFVLLAVEYAKLSKHVLGGAAFVSNLVLWREAGYFDDDASFKPLLHLWSLGVEEQYYIVWPVLLALLWRLRARPLPVCLGILALSFVVNVAMIDSRPTAVFFIPVTRFWELMLGAVLVYATMFRLRPGSGAAAGLAAAMNSPSARDAMSIGGIVLIGLAAALLNKGSLFPGYWALLPTLGTVLIIAAGPAAWLNRTLLSNRGVVYVGLISFPLYLWHWPLLAIARICNVDPLPGSASFALMVASIGLAAATYHWIEHPIRSLKSPLAMRRSAMLLVVAMVTVGAFGWLGFAGRIEPISSRFAHMNDVSAASQDISYDRDRTFAGSGPGKVLMFGDSHMQHYVPRVEALNGVKQVRTRTAVFHTEGGCAPVPRIERLGRHCADFVRDGLKLALDPAIDTVVIAASWNGFISRGDYRAAGSKDAKVLNLDSAEADWVYDRWAADLRGLTNRGKRVVIVLSVPRAAAYDPKRMVRRGWLNFQYAPATVSRADLEAPSRSFDQRLRKVAQASGAEVVDPLDYLCDASDCPTTFDDSKPISTDGSHLRAAFVAKNVRYLDRYLTIDP